MRFAKRVLWWQISSRIARRPILVDYAGGVVLVDRGMTALTSNIYAGLYEFDDLSFVAHFLRPGELFVDVGANVGSYTVLAGTWPKARVIAFEPDPRANARLRQNMLLNDIAGQAFAQAVGREAGTVRFTADHDAIGHVVDRGGIAVEMVSLDSALQSEPLINLIKIDVEGFEEEAIKGAGAVLARTDAAILEQHEESPAHRMLLEHGFRSCKYEPLSRTLRDLDGRIAKDMLNTVYVRDIESVRVKLATAPAFVINGRRI